MDLTAAPPSGTLRGVSAAADDIPNAVSAAAAPRHPAAYARAVAAKLRAQPQAVIAHALETLRRWRAQGHSAPHRLDAWETLLRAAQQPPPENGEGNRASENPGLNDLLRALESDDPASARLRDFHPFHGLLTREERRIVRGPCAYRH